MFKLFIEYRKLHRLGNKYLRWLWQKTTTLILYFFELFNYHTKYVKIILTQVNGSYIFYSKFFNTDSNYKINSWLDTNVDFYLCVCLLSVYI